MNIVRRVAAVCHVGWLEFSLALSIVFLIGQLCWPSAVRWWHFPSLGTVGLDQFQSGTMAEQFVIYLPETYRKRELWPLVVFLHGSGERGIDLDVLRSCGLLRLKLGAIIAVPQCLPSYSWE